MMRDREVRNWIGVIGILLPVVQLIWLRQIPDSISATHYSSAYLWFEGLMVLTGVFLIFYQGYDIRDKIFCRIAATGGLLLAFFPCSGSPFVHFLPISAKVSNVIHSAGAIIFFAMLAYIIAFQFTKTGERQPTIGKMRRNLFYYVCAIVMAVGLIVIGSFVNLFIGEWIALWAFGLAWLVKGGVFLKDR